MVIETNITTKDYLKYYFVRIYKKNLFVSGIMIVGLLILFSLFFYSSEDAMLKISLAIALIIPMPIAIYIDAKKKAKLHSILNTKVLYEFLEDKIIISFEEAKSQVTWEQLHSISELRQWILINVDKSRGYFIPKKDFGEKMEEFRQLVISKPIKQKLYH